MNRTERPDVHFRTTDEMLDLFSFLGEDVAKQIVVDNTHLVADMVDDGIRPVKAGLYPPHMEGPNKKFRTGPGRRPRNGTVTRCRNWLRTGLNWN